MNRICPFKGTRRCSHYHQERVVRGGGHVSEFVDVDRPVSKPQERNTFHDAASAPWAVNLATIHCVVPKSIASFRTLAPWERNVRSRSTSE